ncbi:MAG: response regulator [Desulfovibrio sp.]|jgi:signal transduction histidine kinase/ActR/RegA family two-component response regulator|nr:response regulator [Desulfovibrio sp.]
MAAGEENAFLPTLNEALQRILKNRAAEAKEYLELLPQGQTRDLLFMLCETHENLNYYAEEIAKGNLSVARPPRDNLLTMSLKNLHSKLSHMVWQIGQIAQGDYSQRLDFMGTLADSFNQMTQQLKQRQEANETIREMYAKLIKSDEVIKLLQKREKERDEALALARRASEAKGTFLANISHEMRTPLNAILGMATIGKNAEESRKKNEAFTKIETASSHLLGVINDILDITQLERQELTLTPIRFHFKKMLQNAADIIALDVEKKRQRFDMDVDEAIPENLTGDSRRLTQIIANLFANAVKFTHEGGIIHLEACLAEEKDDVCVLRIAVSDSGIGIPPERQTQLFKAFEQVEGNSTRKYGGTGLGLAISARLVEMMGGKILLDSSPGKGSTFTFTVNLLRHETSEADTPPAARPQDNFSDFYILLADDVELNREIVIALLESTGIKIDCAENGKEAVRMFCEYPLRYHLVFMDMQMPEMDGLEATRKIRASGAPNALAIPIIAMTANTFEADVERCLEAGMNNHLGKPLDMEAVQDVLRKYLSAGE